MGSFLENVQTNEGNMANIDIFTLKNAHYEGKCSEMMLNSLIYKEYGIFIYLCKNLGCQDLAVKS